MKIQSGIKGKSGKGLDGIPSFPVDSLGNGNFVRLTGKGREFCFERKILESTIKIT